MQRDHEYHETLKPHSSIRTHRNEKDDCPVAAESAYPHELRYDDIAGEHRPGCPPVGPKIAIEKCESFERICAIVRDEPFHAVSVSNDRARQ